MEEDRERSPGQDDQGVSEPAKRGAIDLGDLARALKTLNWQDEASAQAIAACLGYGLQTPRLTDQRTSEIYDHQRYSQQPALPPLQQPRRIYVPPAPQPPPPLPAESRPSVLHEVGERAPAAPDVSDVLMEKDALWIDKIEPALARRSLLPERTYRHIVSASLATVRTGQDVDVHALIQAVCRRDLIRDLPRRPEPTLVHGCQLLLDYSATMVPYWEDLSDLINQVEHVVGNANTRTFSFDTAPANAVRWLENGDDEKWQPDGRPLLVATDFGIQGKTGRAQIDDAWTNFIKSCRVAGSPLVILIPWPKDRWPNHLGRYPYLAHWSPHTSAAMVKRRIGWGHKSR